LCQSSANNGVNQKGDATEQFEFTVRFFGRFIVGGVFAIVFFVHAKPPELPVRDSTLSQMMGIDPRLNGFCLTGKRIY
jgi:hypothetical protein